MTKQQKILNLNKEISSLHLLLSDQLKREATEVKSSFKASRITDYKIKKLESKLQQALAMINKQTTSATLNTTISSSLSNKERLAHQLYVKKHLYKSAQALVIDLVISGDIQKARIYITTRRSLEREIRKIEEKLCQI